MSEQEFFIGWQGKAPEGLGSFLRGKAIVALATAAVLAAVLAVRQETIGLGVFEFGKVREFEGVMLASPAPMLIADTADETSGQPVYFLVNPFKHGFDAAAAAKHHLREVTLRGTLIYQPEDGKAMIEVVPGSLASIGEAGVAAAPRVTVLGRKTLRGEIVDSKCYLGVMNPGRGKAHRACAIRCISGGIPPVLLVRSEKAKRATYYLLVDEDGEAINREVLDKVALPVEIPGKVEKVGTQLVLKASPEAIKIIE